MINNITQVLKNEMLQCHMEQKKLQYPTVMRSINNTLSTESLSFITWFKMCLFRTLKVIPLQNTFSNPNRAEKIKLGKTASTQTI